MRLTWRGLLVNRTCQSLGCQAGGGWQWFESFLSSIPKSTTQGKLTKGMQKNGGQTKTKKYINKIICLPMCLCRWYPDHSATSSAVLDFYVTLACKMWVAVTCRTRWDNKNALHSITLYMDRGGAATNEVFKMGAWARCVLTLLLGALKNCTADYYVSGSINFAISSCIMRGEMTIVHISVKVTTWILDVNVY